MATPMTHRYIPRIEQTEENLFIEEYYSSTDTKIYIDDTEQSEIAYINYSLQEQLKPIYGYASRTFDDIAIGSRIVTGVFKVTIKNPEAQTPLSTIGVRSKTPTIENYNDNQQELIDAIDWITNGETTTTDDSLLFEDDETFEYKTKLIKLGYELDYNSNTNVLTQQIKKFQSDHKGLEVNGKLTSSTKDKINEALDNANIPTMSLSKGEKIYLKPLLSSGYETIIEDQEVYILNDISYDSGWVYIMTKDGKEGYIKTKGA